MAPSELAARKLSHCRDLAIDRRSRKVKRRLQYQVLLAATRKEHKRPLNGSRPAATRSIRTPLSIMKPTMPTSENLMRWTSKILGSAKARGRPAPAGMCRRHILVRGGENV